MSTDTRALLRARIVEALHLGDCHDHPLTDHTEEVPSFYGEQADKVLAVFSEVRVSEWIRPGCAVVFVGADDGEPNLSAVGGPQNITEEDNPPPGQMGLRP